MPCRHSGARTQLRKCSAFLTLPAGKTAEWLKQYPWTAYCLPFMGGMRQALCGQCLRLTNQRTKAQLTARIVDMCGHGGEPLPFSVHVLMPYCCAVSCCAVL